MPKKKLNHYNAIVLGLGAHGTAVVDELARQNKQSKFTVLGIDQYSVGHRWGSSFGESRMMRFAHPSGDGIYCAMAQRSRDLLQQLETEMSLAAGAVLKQTGSVYLSSSYAENTMLERLSTDARQRQVNHQRGAPEIVSTLLPTFQSQGEAVYFEEDSYQINTDVCLQARLDRAQRHGADIRLNDAVISYQYNKKQGVTYVTTSQHTYTTDCLVVATGPWSTPLFSQYGIDMPVYKASIFWFKVDESARASYLAECFPIAVCDAGGGSSVLIFPLADESDTAIRVVYFPAILQREGIDMHSMERQPTPAEHTAVVNFISKRFSGITAECVNSWVSPYTDNSLKRFLIDYMPGTDNSIILLSACSRQGFKYSQAIGQAVAQQVFQSGSDLDLFKHFSASFSGVPVDGEPKVMLSVREPLTSVELKNTATYAQSICSYALSIFMMACSFTINGKLLVETGDNGPAAASIVTTFQTVVLGIATGCVLSSGICMGEPMGRKNYTQAGDVAKSAWLWTAAIATLASALLFTSPQTLPLMFEAKAASKAADFFQGYGVGTFPTLFLMTTPQIATQAGDWKVPVVSAALNYIPGVVLSACFAFTCNLGAFGVGLGGGLSAWPVALGAQWWLTREHYAPLKLYHPHIKNVTSHIRKLAQVGAVMALQRLTEWGNLFTLAVISGSWGENNLASMNASLQLIVIFNLASQGVAHATGMLCRSQRSAMMKTAQELDEGTYGPTTVSALQQHTENLQKILRTSQINFVFNGILALAIHTARAPLATFFLGHEVTSPVQHLTEKLLSINAVGLLCDAPRITLAGGLRGWVDVVWPTMVCLILMTAVGAPAGCLLAGEFEAKMETLFWVRNLTMLVSTAVIFNRLVAKYNEDSRKCLHNQGQWMWCELPNAHDDQSSAGQKPLLSHDDYIDPVYDHGVAEQKYRQ